MAMTAHARRLPVRFPGFHMPRNLGQSRCRRFFLGDETVVRAAPQALPRRDGSVEARVVDACTAPITVFELAAATGLPRGVVKVVVTELAERGALETSAVRPDTATLRRVIDALVRL
ncbi:DUF742 domain-containing protein [Streptomonospora sp. NEAU-YY374]|nr:DUF742 domain-containing protein [Streptomonospora nanhaiensis]